MNDINLEIVHEVNVRFWKQKMARITPASIAYYFLQYLLIPAIIAWHLA